MTKNIERGKDTTSVELMKSVIDVPESLQVLNFSGQEFSKQDLQSVIELYKTAFAEPPWNESWSTEAILGDLEMAQSQSNFIMVVAKVEGSVVGFAWGYDVPMEKFPFLNAAVPSILNCSYMDEIAVDSAFRNKGVGRKLVDGYAQLVSSKPGYEARKALRIDEVALGVVLRTDVNNVASMKLFCREGFAPVKDAEGCEMMDPEYPTRIYLWRT